MKAAPPKSAHFEETLPGGVKHEIIEINGDDGEVMTTPRSTPFPLETIS